jgi:hypothetical protein
MVTILTTPILTNYGKFSYRSMSVEQARSTVRSIKVKAFVPDQPTVDIINRLLDTKIEPNPHIERFHQQVGDSVLVFSFNADPSPERIYSIDAIESIGYTIGVLTMISD